MGDKINMHSLVLLNYSLKLTDGTVVESSFTDDPVEITMGHGQLTEGMELAIYGLGVGDEQTLTLTAEQGFGIRDEDNIHNVPISDFPPEVKAEVGLVYAFDSPEGIEIPGTVLELNKKTVKVDFNHPLANHILVFSVEILDINNAHSQVLKK